MSNKYYETTSSETFFHFTDSIEKLIGILENSFEPRYCLEPPDYLTKDLKTEMAFPMVCFCDIPLSKIKRHIGTYGNYGIGLSKNWGFKKKLSPIIYSNQTARTAQSFEKLINWYNKNLYKENPDRITRNFARLFSDFLMFTKPYSGKMYKNGKRRFVRFYDEREWRWIPRVKNKNVWTHLTKDQFMDEEFKKGANQLISQFHRLHFQSKDINYLIVNNESEIDQFIISLERTKNNFDPITIRKLTSRIITRERIMSDF